MSKVQEVAAIRVLVGASIAVIILSCSAPAVAQSPYVETNTEAMVVCPGVTPPKALTSVAFANSQLVSLWWARNAASTEEIDKAGQESPTWLSFVTALMPVTKTSTNSFICAKRSLLPFATGKTDGNITTAAQVLALVYYKHIDINVRTLDLLKKMDTLKQAELADQLSTLQIERGQRWADLVEPTTLALMGLVDQTRIENDRLPYLVVTKAEKKDMLDWALAKFPEFNDGTPRDKWSDPAKTANMYFTLLNGRKCADEK
jgi:hypothetical protein